MRGQVDLARFCASEHWRILTRKFHGDTFAEQKNAIREENQRKLEINEIYVSSNVFRSY